MCVLELVPGVVFSEVREEFQALLDKERTTRNEKYESTMRELRNTKVCFHVGSTVVKLDEFHYATNYHKS